MVEKHCFANMVGYRESLANWVGLLDSAMEMMKGMIVVTNSGREVDFSTLNYIVEHDIVEAGKKKVDLKTYLFVATAIDSID